MCTVTFVPFENGYFLASNRDEKYSRKIAVPPTEKQIENYRFIFPRDTNSNGTWILLKENGDSLCLLNGAFEQFIENKTFKTSRGKVVLEIAASPNMVHSFLSTPLCNTAPFTLIIVSNLSLFECRWDGMSKFYKLLNSNKAYIWSSVTLYNNNQQNLRSLWFENWLSKNQAINLEQLHSFHKNTGIGNPAVDLVMNRNDEIFTVSITSIKVEQTLSSMQYIDLRSKTVYKNFTFHS